MATGACYHSVIPSSAKNEWYIVYHRRPLGETETDVNHQITLIDKMLFDEKGLIKPVKITMAGVERRPIK